SVITLRAGTSNSTIFAGVVQDGTGHVALQKVGSGTLTLKGSNTYSGATFLDAGTLALGNSNASGTNTLTMRDGTTRRSALAGVSVGNDVSIIGNSSVSIDSNGLGMTLAGPILGSGITLNKIGGGTLTLSGNSAYTGTTNLGAGTLRLSHSKALGGS